MALGGGAKHSDVTLPAAATAHAPHDAMPLHDVITLAAAAAGRDAAARRDVISGGEVGQGDDGRG